ncbi:MAG: glycosyltransferase family 39 protein [Solirubrobacterales bacterium]
MIDGVKLRLADWRADSRAWIGLRGFDLWILVGVWSVLSVVVFWLATGHESPRRYQDEFLFWNLAQAFAGGEGLTWRGVGIGLYSFLYPVLLAPAFWVGGSVAPEYTLVHLINSLMMVAVIFPAYLMARPLMGRGAAFLAAALAASVPAMNYAGVIGTEALAYPVATGAFGAMIYSIAQPRRRNWILALAMILVAALTRAQFVVLGPIYLVALVLAGVMRQPETRREFWRAIREPLILMVAGAVLVGLAFLVRGRGAVGLYQGIFDGVSPDIGEVMYWAKALMADVYVVAAVIPVVATLAMFLHKDSRRDPLVGALLAVTLIASLAFVAQVTLFSATNPYDWRNRNIFYERYIFYLGPLFFTGLLVAWRRVSLYPAIASSALAVLVMSGFQTDSVLVPFSYDSFGMTLIGHYMSANPDDVERIGTLLAGLTAVLCAVYCISRLERSMLARYFGIASILITIGILGWGQAKTWQLARLYSHDAFVGVPKPADFVDKGTDSDVGMIVTSTDAPEMYFTAEFWNEKIVRAFATEASPIKTPIMYSPTCNFDWNETGTILGTGCDMVPRAFFMRNETVSMHLKNEVKYVHPTPSVPSLTLMESNSPAAILSFVDGRNVTTGVVQGALNIRTFLEKPGRLRITFGETGARQHVIVGDQPQRQIPANQSATLTARVPAFDQTLPININNRRGEPLPTTVTQIELRQDGGDWVSIL